MLVRWLGTITVSAPFTWGWNKEPRLQCPGSALDQKVGYFVCDPLWNVAVARGLVNPHYVKKKHDAPPKKKRFWPWRKEQWALPVCPCLPPLVGKQKQAPLPTTPSAYVGHVLLIDQAGFLQPRGSSTSSSGVKKQSLKSESKPWEEFNSPTSVFRLSLTLWFEVKLDCI